VIVLVDVDLIAGAVIELEALGDPLRALGTRIGLTKAPPGVLGMRSLS